MDSARILESSNQNQVHLRESLIPFNLMSKKITRALISVFYKDGLDAIVHELAKQDVEFVSTGGTQEFIEKLGYKVTPVEQLTGYPSIFGGRVKTLNQAVFGGILFRRYS